MPKLPVSKVYCEIDPDSLLPIRILDMKEVLQLSPKIVAQWPRAQAVAEIRRQVFERDAYECRRCGKRLNMQTGHMDERVSRGEGGDISIANCWLLCASCHVGDKPTSEHGNRRIRFGEGT